MSERKSQRQKNNSSHVTGGANRIQPRLHTIPSSISSTDQVKRGGRRDFGQATGHWVFAGLAAKIGSFRAFPFDVTMLGIPVVEWIPKITRPFAAS